MAHQSRHKPQTSHAPVKSHRIRELPVQSTKRPGNVKSQSSTAAIPWPRLLVLPSTLHHEELLGEKQQRGGGWWHCNRVRRRLSCSESRQDLLRQLQLWNVYRAGLTAKSPTVRIGHHNEAVRYYRDYGTCRLLLETIEGNLIQLTVWVEKRDHVHAVRLVKHRSRSTSAGEDQRWRNRSEKICWTFEGKNRWECQTSTPTQS